MALSSVADGVAGDEAPGRVPPHDLAAERAVLSALLLDQSAFNEVQSELKAEDFYHPANALLYLRMVLLHEEGRPVDLITLHAALSERKELDTVGGAVYLGEISDVVASAANVTHYAQIVRDKAVKRRLIGVATEIVSSGYNESEPAKQMLDFAESRIFDVSKEQSRSTFQNVHEEMATDTFDYIDRIYAKQGALTGLPTGFSDLDALTGGLQESELIILAARPSMGKTAFALNIARNAAVDHNKKVAVFSLEMTTRSLIMRLLSSEARVDSSSLRKGFMSNNEYKSLKAAADNFTDAAIWLDDSGSLSILEIKAKSRRLKAEQEGLDLVIVDYLQLVRGENQNIRKDLEIGEISRGLKALAKELELPVLALSQLNRGPEQRDPDKRRPMMGDLRESGAIEQDADVVAFIYRDVVYNRTTEDTRKAEILVEKQRNGPTGVVNLDFDGHYARFDNRSKRLDEPPPASGFVGPEGGPPGGPDFGHSDFDADQDF